MNSRVNGQWSNTKTQRSQQSNTIACQDLDHGLDDGRRCN